MLAINYSKHLLIFHSLLIYQWALRRSITILYLMEVIAYSTANQLPVCHSFEFLQNSVISATVIGI